MPFPFASSTWQLRTPAPPENNRIVSTGLIDAAGSRYIVGATGAHDIVGLSQEFNGIAWLSKNAGQTWTRNFESTPSVNFVPGSRGGPISYFKIGANYFRVRLRYGISFFVNNGTLFPGDLTLDWSEDAEHWFEQQQLYTWPQINKGAVGSQASVQSVVNPPVFIPAAKAVDGVDTHLMTIALHVFSPPSDTVIQTFSFWKSLDGGFSWTFDRELSVFPQFASPFTPTHFSRNPKSGRIHLGRLNISYSDNQGASWTNGTGVIGLTKVSPVYCPGNTMAMFEAPGGASSGGAHISCDDGGSWAAMSQTLAGANSGISALHLSPQEILAVAPNIGGDVVNQVWWSDNGGETFTNVGTIALGAFDNAVFIGLGPGGRPMVVSRFGNVALSNDTARSSASQRTHCPLGTAMLKRAGKLNICAGTITHICRDHA